MSDAPESGAPRSGEMDKPDEANDEEFGGDEVTDVTPPNAEEGEEAPEAD